MPSPENFADRMRWWCENGDLGYNQKNRTHFYVGGEVDCSSLVIAVLRECGFETGEATYTGNMLPELSAHGWSTTSGPLSKGDILLNEKYHTAAYLGGGLLAQASIDERGMISGGRPGDQTGRETNVTAYYDYPWTHVLRYQGGSDDVPMTENEFQIGENEMFIVSRVGDEAAYLVNGNSMIQINFNQAQTLFRAGVKRVHMSAQDVYDLMEIIHLTAADADKTASSYNGR